MKLMGIVATTLMLIYVAMIGVVVYALVHFVLKFW